jgi:phosphoglycolate phosphatase
VADAWSKAVEDELGYNPRYTKEDMNSLFGKTMEKIADSLFPEMEYLQRQTLMKVLIRYEDDFLANHSGDIYPGVPETIQALSKRYPLFILSNCQIGYIDLVMDYGGFRDCITDQLCFEDTHLTKGENLKVLMEKHRLKRPVYVGDTHGDWDACKAAGVDMIYAAYGLGKVEGLPTIHSFYELNQLL